MLLAEIVAVGTELLLGQIVDTNSSWIGEQLALHGIGCRRQVKVGDNVERITAAINDAAAAADVVIVCGGLGPTHDDVTRDAIAAVLGEPLVEDEAMVERIIAMFESRGRRMPMSNLVQAMKPPSAEFLAVQPGTAPGLRCEFNVDGAQRSLYAVPGVPWEMTEMMSKAVLPEIRQASGETGVIRSRTLRTWGMSEAGVGEALAPLIARHDTDRVATLALLASGVEGIKVRITAATADVDTAEAVLDAESADVRSVLGDAVFSQDDETMEAAVLGLLGARSWRLAVAESLTGGMVASRICDVPGASEVFVGGVVSYATTVKHDVLGVQAEQVVSEAAALEMARGVRDRLGAEVGIATTGVAGPAAAEGQPVGTVCLAAVGPFGEVSTEVHLPGRRRQIRELACISAMDLLRRQLLAL